MKVESIDLFTPEFIENPYDVYAMLRENAPVFLIAGMDFWVVSRYEDCRYILHHPDLFRQGDIGGELVEQNVAMLEAFAEMLGDGFSTDQARSLVAGEGLIPALGRIAERLGGYRLVDTLVTCDPPAHTVYRTLVDGVMQFTQRVRDMEPQIHAIANEFIDTFASRGSADLMREYAYPLPVSVILEILGLPRSDTERAKRWSDLILAPLAGSLTKEQTRDAVNALLEWQLYMADALESRRSHPRDDVLTAFANAEIEGRALEMPELLSILMQLFVAGHETTTNTIGSAAWLILSDEARRNSLIADPTRIPVAVEETLRLEAPVQGLFRQAVRDVEVGGVAIPAGGKIFVLYAAANRDGMRFPKPNEMDLERPNARDHFSFGHGPHLCVGAPLGRRESQIALDVLLTRLKDLRLASGRDIGHIPHAFLRGIVELKVEFDPIPA